MSSPRSSIARSGSQSLVHSPSHPVLRSARASNVSTDSFSVLPGSPRKLTVHASPLAASKKAISFPRGKSGDAPTSDVRGSKATVKLDPLPSSPRKPISRPSQKPSPREPEPTHLRPVTATRSTVVKTVQLKQSPSQHSITQWVTQTTAPKSDTSNVQKEHLLMLYNALVFAQSLPAVDPGQLAAKRISLPKRPGWSRKKTIIFDLDETLVHCCEEASPSIADVSLPITFPTGEVVKVQSTQAGINIRPYVRECLQAANADFEVMVFTASHRCYADVVLDYLDPDRSLIHHRLYRDNCVIVGGVYIKDLRIFANRSLEEIAIVDNAAYSFAFQMDNGIPIVSWKEDKADRELQRLGEYLRKLASVPDVRVLNAKTFRLRTFVQNYSLEGGEVRKLTSPRNGTAKAGKLSIH